MRLMTAAFLAWAPQSVVAQAADAQPREAGGGERVSVLVHLQRGASRAAVRQFATQHGGVVKYEYALLPDVVNLRGIPQSALNALEAVPAVVRWEEDREVQAFLNDSTPLIRALQSQIAAAGLSADGTGVRVCVVDTGIDSDSAMYADRIDVAAGRDFANGDMDPEDDHGHGSHVAGIAVGADSFPVDFGCVGPEPFQGVAPQATLIGVKVLNSGGLGTLSDVIAGIDYCADQGPTGGRADVINLSIGTGTYQGSCDGADSAAAANAAVDAGVVVVAATGNSGLPIAMAEPACGSKVIAVGASYDDTFPNCDFPTLDTFDFAVCTDQSPGVDEIACFSNGGEALDVVAPGCLTFSADPDNSPQGIIDRCGTSMASPHVAGLAALLLSADPTLSPADVRQLIRSGAVDLGAVGFDPVYGHGRIDAVNTLDNLANPCLTDADCDDGLFCTRDDVCIAGICYHINSPCPGQVCDEEDDACIGCLSDGDCDDGDYCTIDRCDNAHCEYEFIENCPDGLVVTDLGAVGTGNIAWSLNQLGDAVGWSDFTDGTTEGFVASCGQLIEYVGFTPGTTRSDMLSVNNNRQAVGKTGTVHEPGRAVMWTHQGGLQSLGTLGGDDSSAVSINDLGQVVGSSELADNFATRAFLWEAGVMTALPTLGGDHAQGRWINNAGQIVGDSTLVPGSSQYYGCIWENGTVTQLPPINGLNHLPSYIHDNGDIAGWVRLYGGYSGTITRAAIWRDGELHRVLGTLADGSPEEPYATSTASAINASGIVVGMSVPPEGGYIPFIQVGDEMMRLDDLVPDPWQTLFVGAGSINDSGQIVTRAFQPGAGETRALLLTPILRPLPGDFDENGAVDLNDFASAAACLGAPNVALPNSDCAVFDFDSDEDSDLEDFAYFQRLFTGGSVLREVAGQTCQDGIDNDTDGASDCDDVDCATDPLCSPCHCGEPGEPCLDDIDCCTGRCKGNGTCR
jgi:probable HAF family extracellular repeat protein